MSSIGPRIPFARPRIRPEKAWWYHSCEDTAPCGRKSTFLPTTAVRQLSTRSSIDISEYNLKMYHIACIDATKFSLDILCPSNDGLAIRFRIVLSCICPRLFSPSSPHHTRFSLGLALSPSLLGRVPSSSELASWIGFEDNWSIRSSISFAFARAFKRFHSFSFHVF
jgi:hypothetical protein